MPYLIIEFLRLNWEKISFGNTNVKILKKSLKYAFHKWVNNQPQACNYFLWKTSSIFRIFTFLKTATNRLNWKIDLHTFNHLLMTIIVFNSFTNKIPWYLFLMFIWNILLQWSTKVKWWAVITESSTKMAVIRGYKRAQQSSAILKIPMNKASSVLTMS